MNVGFYQSVGALRSLQAQQELLAGNLARQGVSGHRAAVAAVVTEAPRTKGPPADIQIDPTPRDAAPTAFRVVTANDFSTGALERTGNPLHLAVEGTGFFTVRDLSGATAYTRGGAFTRSADGVLTLADGSALLDEGGQPLTILDAGRFTVAPDGVVMEDGAEVGRIGLTGFAAPGTELQELRPGLFYAAAGAEGTPVAPGTDRVLQGTLEQSNVQPVTQMVAMVSVLRAYEANQKVMGAADEATGRLLRAAAPGGV